MKEDRPDESDSGKPSPDKHGRVRYLPPMMRGQNFPETRPSLLASLGDDGASQPGWREFFRCYAPAVYRVARQRGLGDADADDIVQQVMCQVSKHIGRFDYLDGRHRFRNWIRTIAEHKIVDLFRKRRSTLQVVDDIAECDAVARTQGQNEWNEQWRLMDLAYCIEQLAKDISPRRMQAFRMYSLEGRPVSEVCEALGMSVNSVYVTRCQVLNLIKERLESLDGPE